MLNIINRRTLLEYCSKYPAAAIALQEWYHEFAACSCRTFNELKQMYAHASLVGDDRVVFNFMGNRFRLVVRVVFEFKVVQIKWFGTHQAYDRIDVRTVQHKSKK